MDAEPGPRDRYSQLIQAISPGGVLIDACQLHGGVSAQVSAVRFRQPGGTTQQVVVRRHAPRDLAANPHIAADEFRLLEFLYRRGLPVPRPIAVDQEGAWFGSPCLVTEFVEGHASARPEDVEQATGALAAQLARIHQLDGADRQLAFLPHMTLSAARRLAGRPERLDDTIEEGRTRATLAAAWPPPQANPIVLLHGDFWPGNILWHHGQIGAVLDWEDAAVGDPLADLANTRLELAWQLGREAMQRFTEQYQALARIDCAALPWWDLYAALKPAGRIDEWAADQQAARAMRETHRWFRNQAFERLDRT
jgi:aminoglycoside phosphotransferase (APT) family kinase protein